MDFKDHWKTAMEHWKVLPGPMVGWQENVLNSRVSGMAKTEIFWPWWQLFNSFCFETLCFSFSLPVLFATQKSKEDIAPPSGVAGPVSSKLGVFINCERWFWRKKLEIQLVRYFVKN